MSASSAAASPASRLQSNLAKPDAAYSWSRQGTETLTLIHRLFIAARAAISKTCRLMRRALERSAAPRITGAGGVEALDAYDFARSDLSADGAWPIGKQDLDPYFADATAMLRVTEFSGVDAGLADADGNLQTIRMYFSKPPANLGYNYFGELQQSNNITLLLNAPYLSAALDADRATVNSIAVHDRRSPSPLICRARHFVFAMGTIENVRHLLILNRKNPNRFSNIGGDLGRYYMQHLHQELGQFVILKEGAAPAFAQRNRAFMASTEKYLRYNGRGAFRLYSTRLTSCSELIDRFRNVVTGASCHGAALGRNGLYHM